MRGVRTMLSWALALFLVAMFVHLTLHPLPNPPAGRVLLLDPPGENIVFQTIAERSRFVNVEPGARVVVAYLQLAASLLLLLPWTRRLGAGLAFLVLAGAVGVHLSPWLGRETPLSLDPASALTDGGAQFSLAIAMLVGSLLVMVVHPGRR